MIRACAIAVGGVAVGGLGVAALLWWQFVKDGGGFR